MTATLLLTCVLSAPANPPAVMPAPAVPVVVAAPMFEAGGGCGSCGTGICGGAQDPCPFEKKGLFAKLRNLFRPKGKCVECVPPVEKEKSKGLFGRFKRPVNYCGAGGCGTATAAPSMGYAAPACSGCDLPPIPGSVPVAPTPAPAPVPVPVNPAPVGEGKPAAGKVNVVIPEVPAPMPAPAGKPAF